MVNNNGTAEVYQVCTQNSHYYSVFMYLHHFSVLQWNTEHSDWIKVSAFLSQCALNCIMVFCVTMYHSLMHNGDW